MSSDDELNEVVDFLCKELHKGQKRGQFENEAFRARYDTLAFETCNLKSKEETCHAANPTTDGPDA